MTLNRKLAFAIVLLLSLALTACGAAEEGASSAVLTQAAQIYSDSLTQTAAVAPPTATATVAAPTATNTSVPPTFTPTVTGTPPTNTPVPSTPTQQAGGGNTGGGGSSSGCLRAELSYETIPDGTQLEIEQSFQKRWVLKNVGTCTWSQEFSLAFVDGDLLGAKASQAFADFTDVDIPPGERIDMSVAMKAPAEAGTYRGNWMLRADSGILFGLGPDGRAWFWVEVRVED